MNRILQDIINQELNYFTNEIITYGKKHFPHINFDTVSPLTYNDMVEYTYKIVGTSECYSLEEGYKKSIEKFLIV